MELKNIYGDVIFAFESAKTVLELVTAARAAKANLDGANLDGANLDGTSLNGASLYHANLNGASLYRANLDGANLNGASLYRANLNGVSLNSASLNGANLDGASLNGANLNRASLYCANLNGANLDGALIDGKPIVTLRVFSGLYSSYTVQAVLFRDGSRWVRMGCLWKSLDEWEAVGIRKSNLHQFPDDGSDRCEERVAAFEFAKTAALRLK
jgi:hypothetical protein